MNDIGKSINKIKEIAERCKKTSPKSNYRCLACKDTGFVITENVNLQPTFTLCTCRKKEMLKQQWINAGFNIMSGDKSFANFNARNMVAKKMKAIANKYVNEYEIIQFSMNNSIAFLGQPGSGKTHLCMAIALELIKKGFRPLYFPYREVITELKQNAMNSLVYQETISKYKKSNILVIDDLFKNGAADADVRIIFEILNYRYLNRLPIIISSEMVSFELLDIDEAIGSRIREMCKDRITDICGEEYNQRLIK